MNRRIALKQLAVATAAAWLLPGCVADPKKVSIALNNLQISGDEEDLLGNIADVIIPATDTPGARAVGAHLFTLVMIDDCTGKSEKEKYLKGLRAFDEATEKLSGKSFSKSNADERLAILSKLEAGKDNVADDVKMFYETSREYIVRGYLSSQHFLTDVKPYQLIPGPNFKGCIPVSQQQPA